MQAVKHSTCVNQAIDKLDPTPRWAADQDLPMSVHSAGIGHE